MLSEVSRVTEKCPSDPSEMAPPHTVLDPGKNMAGSFSWQKLKLLKVQLLLPRTLGTKGWVDGNRLL